MLSEKSEKKNLSFIGLNLSDLIGVKFHPISMEGE